MASYKGIEVKTEVRAILPHMPQIDEYREVLKSLQAVWDNLNLLGQLSGTTAEIGQARHAFSSLTSELLNNLAERTLAKREQEMKAKSQVVIDILARNLFERTADIGFLSTDEEIRRFAARAGDASALKRRFNEYVRKYSVYDDVVLLSPDGQILARLQDIPGVTSIREQWLSEAACTSASYVESYGKSALFPDSPHSLIYAYRVNSSHGALLGILALSFRFNDEMARIFAGLSQADSPGVLILLDVNSRVLASNDPWQIPVGAPLALVSNQLQRLRFAGRNYLAFASDTKGYQGYMGPGWRGLIMMPLEQAFEMVADNTLDGLEPGLLASVLDAGRAFSENLRSIPIKAGIIQRDLSRAVWNGTVRHSAETTSSNANFSKILLWEISRIGMSMREVFSNSIGNLHSTVLSALLADSQFFAGLAIDIMDRNLYERANDCRWWALDSTIRELMADGDTRGRQAGLEKVIAYINRLYTVYDNILLFDTDGRISAVSNPAYGALVGTRLDEDWVADCLALNDSQHYGVSTFKRTTLYGERPSYIYHAAVHSPDQRRVTGGIAIVFDSEPQFAAMLNDALPRESSGEATADCFAVFIDRSSRVIASTGRCFKTDDIVALPEDLLNPPSEGCARLLLIDNQVMAVGSRRSTGYREYKGSQDAYRNQVTAAIFIPLGAYNPNARLPKAECGVASRRSNFSANVASQEIATFFLRGHWLGLPVDSVVEAIELKGAARIANAPEAVYGALIYREKSLPIYNLHAALGLGPQENTALSPQVVVVRDDHGGHFGVIVDRLGEILEVPCSDIETLSNIFIGVSSLLASVVKTSTEQGEDDMLVLLSVATMCKQLERSTDLTT